MPASSSMASSELIKRADEEISIEQIPPGTSQLLTPEQIQKMCQASGTIEQSKSDSSSDSDSSDSSSESSSQSESSQSSLQESELSDEEEGVVYYEASNQIYGE